MKIGKSIFFLSILLLLSCGEDKTDAKPAPIGRGQRILGMDMADQADEGDFIADITTATNMGIDFTSLHLAWTWIETGSGTDTNSGPFTDPFSALSGYNSVCNSYNLKLALTIRPIDLTGKTVPADLANMRFTNEIMITRFCLLMDHIFSLLDYRHLTSLQIGNEIDHYNPLMDSDPDFWNHYPIFLQAVRAYLTNQYPGLKVGFTITFSGATGTEQSRYIEWASQMDVVGITYYLMQESGFQVKDPTTVNSDFNTLVTSFQETPIYIQEAGCQTATTCGSSQEIQSDFVKNLFIAWDTHRSAIPLINMTRFNDYSPEKATNTAGDYGLGDFAFIEYLRTLGLTTFNGERKAAFSELSNQLKARNW